MARIENSKRNILYGLFGQLLVTILAFINRTIFIYTLGVEYLGLSGLFTSILSMLSLAELGVGSAITFSLYKPLADADKEKNKVINEIVQNSLSNDWLLYLGYGIGINSFFKVYC